MDLKLRLGSAVLWTVSRGTAPQLGVERRPSVSRETRLPAIDGGGGLDRERNCHPETPSMLTGKGVTPRQSAGSYAVLHGFPARALSAAGWIIPLHFSRSRQCFAPSHHPKDSSALDNRRTPWPHEAGCLIHPVATSGREPDEPVPFTFAGPGKTHLRRRDMGYILWALRLVWKCHGRFTPRRTARPEQLAHARTNTGGLVSLWRNVLFHVKHTTRRGTDSQVVWTRRHRWGPEDGGNRLLPPTSYDDPCRIRHPGQRHGIAWQGRHKGATV